MIENEIEIYPRDIVFVSSKIMVKLYTDVQNTSSQYS
jgi:hypothetical protein